MADFLLELRCEEIPARMQAGARTELEKLMRRELDAAGVAVGDLTVWSTPRRLAVIARGLPTSTEAVREEAKGPPVGAPDQAIEGFCRKNGVTRDQLKERDVKGRATWFAVIEKPGQAVSDLLAAAIPSIIRDFSWPKSMRWGAASINNESTRWVRPLSGIVALLDGEVVPCVMDGMASGRTTRGHRFHSDGDLTIDGADDYAAKLREAYVIVDHEERAAIIREGASKAAADAGLTVVEDEGLVTENAGLTEWPVPLLGRFDESYLDVPPEVIQLTARVNQKYFVCETPLPLAGGAGGGPRDDGGSAPTPDPSRKREGNALASAFICTANIASRDPAVVVDGNRKVLAARLSDARFFWELDQKTPLAEHAKKLERITFHEKLGTVADKVERVAKLARWLVEEGIVGPCAPAEAGAQSGIGLLRSQEITKEEMADLAEKAARLCKADLVTEMVGEFPELQGLMGGYYARAEGLPDEVADAIRDHYKPVGQGDDVPTAPVTVAVSLADKLDTAASFFYLEEYPTGSKDPFALRRASIGILRLILLNNLRGPWDEFVSYAAELAAKAYLYSTTPRGTRDFQFLEAMLGDQVIDLPPEPRSEADQVFVSDYQNFHKRYQEHTLGKSRQAVIAFWYDYVKDRLQGLLADEGVSSDVFYAAGGNEVANPSRIRALGHSLANFLGTDHGTNLLAGYKRAANILKKENYVIPAGPEAAEGLPGIASGGAHTAAMPASAGMTDSAAIDGLGEEDPLALAGKPEFDDAMASHGDANSLSYTPEKAEKALIDALDAAAPKAAQAVSEERFEDAMAALATLRAPIDAFFDEVTVNDADPAKRTARLNLLARFTGAVGTVADFSRIEG